MRNIALVLGGYVNGYSIVRELKDEGVDNIWLFDYGTSLTRKSNKVLGITTVEKTVDSFREALFSLKEHFDYIICFPTDDIQLELLWELKDEICDFCFLPFNHENLKESLDKNIQYKFCEKLGVPYPKTIELSAEQDFNKMEELLFPLLVKPNTRQDMVSDVFRSLYLQSIDDFYKNKDLLHDYLQKGFSFLASEFIPGDDTQIYAYTAYRSKKGEILNEWTGKKLTQYPDAFGVFSSASNEAPETVLEQGRTLLDGMNLYGIAEPEFKYDHRDGQYKLMEINLRSMMWHRVGNLSGVKLQFTQWNDALGLPVIKYKQDKEEIIHFVYMKHEILNLIRRKQYLKFFIQNVFFKGMFFAVFNFRDLAPFIYDLKGYPRGMVATWLKRLSKK
ncbi:hypothetical protein [Acinetobacter sp. YH12116]|uniref:carboxylate--amine ligase n=1 Tax=Acinetobacter sp. YH12116 TaxID=2601103 RepID=UPI0015D30C9B|nr:hypothetical protein [Acinetobacter sp. YH12116]